MYFSLSHKIKEKFNIVLGHFKRIFFFRQDEIYFLLSFTIDLSSIPKKFSFFFNSK